MFTQARCNKVSRFAGSLYVNADVAFDYSLRKSSTALAKLREKLFLLWGDLEERKTTNLAALKEVDGNSRPTEKGKAPNNLPFECCLKEYGVKKKTPDTVEKDGKDDKLESADENEGWVWERRWRMFGTTII